MKKLESLKRFEISAIDESLLRAAYGGKALGSCNTNCTHHSGGGTWDNTEDCAACGSKVTCECDDDTI